MIFFNKKKVNLDEFCRDFYEKYIINPQIGKVNASGVFSEVIKKELVEVDGNFADIDIRKLNFEIVPLRLELFALAWLHQFGDKSAVAQSVFTKHYLLEKRRDNVWNAMESYGQAIARSSYLGKTPKKALDRIFLGNRDKTIADLFDQYHKEGYDLECVVRALNRLFTDTAWKKGVTAGLLMFTLCDRLGFGPNFEPNKEAQFRLTTIIRGFYDGAQEALAKIKLK